MAIAPNTPVSINAANLAEVDGTLTDRISRLYATLSARQKSAADLVLSAPLDTASRSLRTMSKMSGLAPATFSRLAKSLGYEDYDHMREAARDSLAAAPHASRAIELVRQRGSDSARNILAAQATACRANIATLVAGTTPEKMEQAAALLANARRVHLVASLSSRPILGYLHYVVSFFAQNWSVSPPEGAGAWITDLGPEDVVLILTKAPFASHTIKPAKAAQKTGASTIVISNTMDCPIFEMADVSFVVPSDSPQFFASYAGTIVLIEALVAMVVARLNVDQVARIAQIEAENLRLGIYQR